MGDNTPSRYDKKNCLKCDVYEKPKIDNINVCKIKVSNLINNATKHNKCNRIISRASIAQPTCVPIPVLIPEPEPEPVFVWSTLAKIMASDKPHDYFGQSVAMSWDGRNVIVGARGTTAHPTDDDDGSAYIYEYIDPSWVQMANISGSAPNDYFGWSVAMSGDGKKVIVGAPNINPGGPDRNGSAYIYEYTTSGGGSWVQLGPNISGAATDDNFGLSVAMSGDGTKVIVGAPKNDPGDDDDAGSAYIYEYIEPSWVPVGPNIRGEAEDDNFGWSVAMNGDGTKVIVGAPNHDPGDDYHARPMSGSAYIYEYNHPSWVPVGPNISGAAEGDNFGWSVAMSGDGTKVIVGAPKNDPGDDDDAGSAYIYEYIEPSWVPVGPNIRGEAEDDNFGWSVAMSGDGMNVIVGAKHDLGVALSAYIYTYSDSSWNEVKKIVPSDMATNDNWSMSVAMSGNGTKVIVGTPFHHRDSISDAGSAYIYELTEVEPEP